MPVFFTLENMRIDLGYLFGVGVGEVFLGRNKDGTPFEVTIVSVECLYSIVEVTHGRAMSDASLTLVSSPEKLHVNLICDIKPDMEGTKGFVEITDVDPDVTIGPLSNKRGMFVANYRDIAFGEFSEYRVFEAMEQIFNYHRALNAAKSNPDLGAYMVMNLHPEKFRRSENVTVSNRCPGWYPVDVSNGVLRAEVGTVMKSCVNTDDDGHRLSRIVEFSDDFAITTSPYWMLRGTGRFARTLLYTSRVHDYPHNSYGAFERRTHKGEGVTHMVTYTTTGDRFISSLPIEQGALGTLGERPVGASNVDVCGSCATIVTKVEFFEDTSPSCGLTFGPGLK